MKLFQLQQIETDIDKFEIDLTLDYLTKVPVASLALRLTNRLLL
jgi:hypothetical protein